MLPLLLLLAPTLLLREGVPGWLVMGEAPGAQLMAWRALSTMWPPTAALAATAAAGGSANLLMTAPMVPAALPTAATLFAMPGVPGGATGLDSSLLAAGTAASSAGGWLGSAANVAAIVMGWLPAGAGRMPCWAAAAVLVAIRGSKDAVLALTELAGMLAWLPAVTVGVKRATSELPGLESMKDVPLAVLAPALGVGFQAIRALIPV